MEVEYVVHYCDGIAEVLSVEKPRGAHPESPRTLHHVVTEAEKYGKVVKKVGKLYIFGGIPLDHNMMTRQKVIDECTNSCSYFAIHQRFET